MGRAVAALLERKSSFVQSEGTRTGGTFLSLNKHIHSSLATVTYVPDEGYLNAAIVSQWCQIYERNKPTLGGCIM